MKGIASTVIVAVMALVIALGVDTGFAATYVRCDTYKGFTAGNCTCYAALEFDKIAPAPDLDWNVIPGGQAAWEWYKNATGWARSKYVTEPMNGAIVVWKKSDGEGHVAIVRSHTTKGITVDEMNAGSGLNYVDRRTYTYTQVLDHFYTNCFVGYIYPRRTADLNNDGKVTVIDLSILLSNWNKTGHVLGDINGNKVVDIFDLSILLTRWGTRGLV